MNTPGQNLAGILIPPDISIMKALEALNSAHKRIILVVDEEQHLLGVVTDSNVRRALLDKINLDGPVSTIMRERPVVARNNLSESQVLQLMEATTHYQIPILDDEDKLVDIRFLDELVKSQAESSVAIVMVGGLGTRLHPLTKDTPKPLLDVGGRPLLFTILEHLIVSGVHKLYLALNFRGESIREAIEAEKRGATYVNIGPLFPTPTKPDAKSIGLEPVRLAVQEVSIPLSVMGGIVSGNIDEVLATGVRHVGVVTAVFGEEDIAGAVRRLSLKVVKYAGNGKVV